MELQVGVKILLKNEQGEYLVIRRNSDKYPETGAKWDIAGGRIDSCSSLLDSLKREVAEETGLNMSDKADLITAQDILKNDKHVVRLTYMGRARGDVVLSEEHSEYKWLSLTEILKLEPLDSYVREVIKDLI